MPLIKHHILENNIHHIELDYGTGNPINSEMIEVLHNTLQDIHQSDPKALLLSSASTRLFSGGFDLPTIAYWSRPKLHKFFNDYLDMLYTLMRLPCITISVIDGHCIAAGFILSLGTDFRICSDKPLKLGLSEVNLGPAVPAGTHVLFESRTSRQAALFYASSGTIFDAQTALRIGYAQQLDAAPLTAAKNMANAFAQKPATGAGLCTSMASERIIAEMKSADIAGMELFLDSWFHPESQQHLQALAAKLSGKTKQSN